MLHPIHGFQIVSGFRRPAIGDQQIQQPKVGSRVFRVLFQKFLVKINQSPIIAHVPVCVRAAFCIKDGVVGRLLVGIQQQRLSGQRCSQLVIFLSPFGVQLRQQQSRPGLALVRLHFFLEEPLRVGEFSVCQEADVLQHVVDALHAALVGHGKQFVDGHAEGHGQLRQQLDIRRGEVGLPLGYRLGGDPQLFSQLLLGHAGIQPQLFDFPSDFDDHHHPSFCHHCTPTPAGFL